MTIRTDLEILPPASPVIAGSDAERTPLLQTHATTDHEILAVWLRAHADGSRHARRASERIGRRFVDALAATGANLRRHTTDDVHAALEAMRTRADGTPASARPSQTLGHTDLKTTSVYAHAKPNDSSSRYLKRT